MERTAGWVRRLLTRMRRRRIQAWRIYGGALGRGHTPHSTGVACIYSSLRKKEMARGWIRGLCAHLRHWHHSNANTWQLRTAYHRWQRDLRRSRRRKTTRERALRHFTHRPPKAMPVVDAIETIEEVGVNELPPKLVRYFKRRSQLQKGWERWRRG